MSLDLSLLHTWTIPDHPGPSRTKVLDHKDLNGLGRVFYIFMDVPGPLQLDEVMPKGPMQVFFWVCTVQ